MNFKEFIEKELEVGRATIYKYIFVFGFFGVSPVRHISLSEKFSSYYALVPYVKKYPKDKEKLIELAEKFSRRELKSKLKEAYSSQEEREGNLLKEDWYFSLREGMKRNTTTKILKELLNWKILEDPNNKTLLKIKERLNQL